MRCGHENKQCFSLIMVDRCIVDPHLLTMMMDCWLAEDALLARVLDSLPGYPWFAQTQRQSDRQSLKQEKLRQYDRQSLKQQKLRQYDRQSLKQENLRHLTGNP
jgi:hypothetical protein